MANDRLATICSVIFVLLMAFHIDIISLGPFIINISIMQLVYFHGKIDVENIIHSPKALQMFCFIFFLYKSQAMRTKIRLPIIWKCFSALTLGSRSSTEPF